MNQPKPSQHELDFFQDVYEKHYLSITPYLSRLVVTNYRTGIDTTLYAHENRPTKTKLDKNNSNTFLEIFCK